MPGGRRVQFYDPQIQSRAPQPEPPPQEAPQEAVGASVTASEPLRGLAVAEPGLYLLAADVASYLRGAGLAYPEGELRRVLLAAAEAFEEPNILDPAEVDEPSTMVESLEAAGMLREPLPLIPAEVVAEPVLDPHPEVARVEVYPDASGKWHARPVASDGSILWVTDGSFDHDWVIQDAEAQWPGKRLHELLDPMGDSIWDEQDSTVTFNGRRRPSPRRLWSQ